MKNQYVETEHKARQSYLFIVLLITVLLSFLVPALLFIVLEAL